jgi:hypothetical protein
MKKHLLPLLVTVIVATQGCLATTPSEIRALGVRGQAEINQPYTQAASCLMGQIDKKENRSISRSNKVINHTLRIDQEGENAEIIANPIIGDESTGYETVGGIYVLSIHPSGPNSSIVEIYVSNNIIFRGAVTDSIKKAASNCNH